MLNQERKTIASLYQQELKKIQQTIYLQFCNFIHQASGHAYNLAGVRKLTMWRKLQKKTEIQSVCVEKKKDLSESDEDLQSVILNDHQTA